MANKVIAGEYEGKSILANEKKFQIVAGGFGSSIILDKSTVKHYEQIDENSMTTSKKGFVRSAGKGAVGAVAGSIVAPGIGTLIGAGAGIATSKRKVKNIREMMIHVELYSGEEMLLSLDSAGFKHFMVAMYRGFAPSEIGSPKHKQAMEKQIEKQKNEKKSNVFTGKLIMFLFAWAIMTGFTHSWLWGFISLVGIIVVVKLISKKIKKKIHIGKEANINHGDRH